MRQRPANTAVRARSRPALVLQVGHSSFIIGLAFSPDGKILASGSLDGTARLWDARSGQPRATLEGHTGQMYRLALSPDGKTLATGSEDGTARLWDARSGQVRAILRHPNPVMTLSFSPDGRTLATGSWDAAAGGGWAGTARLWDTRSGQLKATLPHPHGVYGVAFSPDGKILATGSGNDRLETEKEKASPGETRLWDVQRRRLLATLPGPPGAVLTLAFSPDGKLLATGGGFYRFLNDKRRGEPGEAYLWEVASRRRKAVLRGHTDTVERLAFSPDGKTLVTGSEDNSARLWDTQSGQMKAILSGSRGAVAALAFSPDGNLLATGEGWEEQKKEASARLWDARSGQLKATLQGHTYNVNTLAFSPDSHTLATGDSDGTVRLWDTGTGQLKTTLQRHTGWVLARAVSPDGRTLATGSTDGPVRLWDMASGELRATLLGHTERVRALLFSADGQTLVSGSDDRIARLWDARTGQLKLALPEHEDDVVSLAYSPDGRTLATGSMDVRLWDAESGRLKATLKGHTKGAWTLAFSPDGQTLASGSWDRTARLWDTRSGQLKAILQGHTDSVETLAFSPDGRALVTAGVDKTARVWGVPGGDLKATLQGNTEPVWQLRFSPDGQTLVTVGWTEVRLWNPSTGQPRATLQANRVSMRDLAFSPDGRALATVTISGRVLLWDGKTGKAIPTSPQTRWSSFPSTIARPISDARSGAAVLLHHPLDGRLLATLLPLPEAAAEVAAARPIAIGARAAPTSSDEWFVTTPEGYFDSSANAARFIQWNVNGVLYPAERYLRRFRRPDLVRKALRGERITAPAMTEREIPPAVQFVGLKPGDPAPGDPMRVTVEVRDDRDVKEVVLLLNGRPLPPERARPIEVGARPIVIGARPIEVGAREGDPNHRLAKRLTFQVPLPLGAQELRLRAVAYDDTDLGSDPVELVLQRAEARPVAGRLYVLSVGVSRYRNADGKRFQNLQFATADARAIAARFQREGRPLYEQVHVRTLTDDQATAASVRAELKRLQETVRPGQIDTVVIFLSGHGVSMDGRYYFATHEFDLGNLLSTSLSGQELREALGGKLRAKAVFLFVDTCHAGGLGGRNDDLALEVGEGVYLLASSGAKGYSYESPSWGHGAFTLAVLRALDRMELARDGVIHFNALAYAVPDEVASLMKQAGRNESEQEPCIPLAARRLRVSIAQAAR